MAWLHRAFGWMIEHIARQAGLARSRAGDAFVRVAVDDHSRNAGIFERACTAFARSGVARRRALTDNGACYKSAEFAAQCRAPGVRQEHTR